MQEIIYFIYIIGYVCTAHQNNYSTCFQKSVYLELYIFSSYVTYLVGFFYLRTMFALACLWLSMVIRECDTNDDSGCDGISANAGLMLA